MRERDVKMKKTVQFHVTDALCDKSEKAEPDCLD